MARYKTGRKVPAVDLGKVLKDMLEEYGQEVREEVSEVLDDMGPDIAKKVASKSPVGGDTEHYKDGWTYEVKTDVYGQAKATIYNSTKPTLTHLLEFGHRGYPLKNGGRTPDVKGIPHIKPAQEWAEDEAVKRIERKLKEQ